jgi:NADH pyrophosphatase NudC (nudix superfamily)
MLTWNTTHKFCHFCGNEMKKTYSGCLRKCSSGCEKKEQYPPIHPVAITRVLDHNREKALLVRQSRYPKGMYSCIAGKLPSPSKVRLKLQLSVKCWLYRLHGARRDPSKLRP